VSRGIETKTHTHGPKNRCWFLQGTVGTHKIKM